MKEEHVRTVTTFNERMQQFDTYESRFQSLEDRVDDLHARLQSQHSKQDVEMELEPDLAERVRRHNANRRGKMRSEDMLDELSEVRSDVSSSVVHPRSVASSARFW